jgi:hypothetical protein
MNMGYDLKNKPKNLLKYLQIPTYLYSHSYPMGTDKQTNGRTNGGTNKRTNIYSIFRDKLSLPEESSDWFATTTNRNIG